MRRTALITGITGQDGSYLAEYLLKKGYTVHGIIRRSSSFNTGRIDHIFEELHLHHGDMVDSSNLCAILQRVRPDEVYNLAAQSHVKVSFAEPEYTSQADGTGTLRLLEALRTCGMDKTARFYQASTSELFGKVQEVPQTETTPFYPRSPYAVAKLFAYWTVINYREAYNMFAVNGILFNHESPRRGGTFVTKKISTALARIVKGTQDSVVLGNLNSRRDWGHARDYVRAMWLMLQTDEPDDFVIATNRQFSVRDFCELSFKMAGIELVWIGEGLDERGVDKVTGANRVQVSPVYFRPTEVDSLLGDSSKAKRELNWEPEVSFVELVHEMVAGDFAEQGVEFSAKLADFLPASS